MLKLAFFSLLIIIMNNKIICVGVLALIALASVHPHSHFYHVSLSPILIESYARI